MGGKVEAGTDFLFFGSTINVDGDCSHEIKTLAPWKKSCDKPRQCIKHRHQPTRFPTVKAVVFPVVLYRCESWTIKKEGWASKNWCFWTGMLEKTLENPLDCKEIKPVHSKGNQSWIFIGRTDADTEALILWLPDVKNSLIWKDPDARKDWRRKEKGTTEDEVVGWHHRLNGHEFEQTPGNSEGWESLASQSIG